MEKELLNSDGTVEALDFYSLRSSKTNCGGCFTHHGDKNPGGVDERRSAFPPLTNSQKSIQNLCQSNVLPVLASCVQMSSMYVMYRPNDGVCTYAVSKEQS